MLHPGPDSKDELIETLVEAQDNEVIGAQSREMLEGVIRMADMTAGDVMVAAPRMDVINIDAPFDELLHLVIDTAHSRFPVSVPHAFGRFRIAAIEGIDVAILVRHVDSPVYALRLN